MAFKYTIRLAQTKRCNELNIFDETGTGETGWGDGTTNPAISGVTAASAKIIFANGATWTGSILSTNPAFPSINSAVPFVFDTLMLGQAFVDGPVTIESQVFGEHNGSEGVLGLYTTTGFIYCHVECCVRKLKAKINPEIDDCEKTPAWRAARKAGALLEALKYAISCKKFDRAKVILKSLQNICANNHCNCS
jgi:hypothetical protein